MKEKEEERLQGMLEIEENLYSKGYKFVCGVDEAGRGPLWGPVVAAAVILREDDKIETFEKRYNTYLEMTEPLIDYYSNKNSLYKIYAGGQKDDTFAAALEVLNKLGE